MWVVHCVSSDFFLVWLRRDILCAANAKKILPDDDQPRRLCVCSSQHQKRMQTNRHLTITFFYMRLVPVLFRWCWVWVQFFLCFFISVCAFRHDKHASFLDIAMDNFMCIVLIALDMLPCMVNVCLEALSQTASLVFYFYFPYSCS